MPAPFDKLDFSPLVSFAFEQVTVSTISKALTAATYDVASTATVPSKGPAKCAVMRLELAEIRYTVDGTVPTSTVGTLLEIGESLLLWGSQDIQAFRAIRTGGTDGQLDVTYSR